MNQEAKKDCKIKIGKRMVNIFKRNFKLLIVWTVDEVRNAFPVTIESKKNILEAWQ
jgi:hypothetical protein